MLSDLDTPVCSGSFDEEEDEEVEGEGGVGSFSSSVGRGEVLCPVEGCSSRLGCSAVSNWGVSASEEVREVCVDVGAGYG